MKHFITFSALTAGALATVYQVTVGPGLDYSPDTITNAVSGDIISFKFGAGHNVVSGSFSNPCQPSGGVYSGDPQNGDIFSVTLNSSDPLWIYCSVPGHCQGGMAMVVNPPSGQTLADYKSSAQSVRGSSQPNNVEGGIFGAVSVASSATSASSSSASASASSSRASTSSSASSASAASSSSAAMSSSSASASSASVSSSSSALASASSAASSVLSSLSTTASVAASGVSTSASGNNAAITGVPAAVAVAAGLLALL